MLRKWLNANSMLRTELSGVATDKFLELLLYGMDSAFWLLKGYKQNIKNFSGMLRKWLNANSMLRTELSGVATDKFLEFLLYGMDSAFWLLKGYKQNIKNFSGKNFSGRYVFTTQNNRVAASAVFKDGDMVVHEEALNQWDVKVTFKNAQALRDFLFSGDQDIVDSLLKNEVEVDGNLNYIYKFGFMARDLEHRLGIV